MLVLVCVNRCDLYIFRCFLSVYTQYLWPNSTISPMQCFYGPHEFISVIQYNVRLLVNKQYDANGPVLLFYS